MSARGFGLVGFVVAVGLGVVIAWMLLVHVPHWSPWWQGVALGLSVGIMVGLGVGAWASSTSIKNEIGRGLGW